MSYKDDWNRERLDASLAVEKKNGCLSQPDPLLLWSLAML